ncbi:hypothetical protein ASZ90_015849 [hydrocarbon metagenome]|uniref:Uncharacterized protein n=1 Tax=hydrocarbon metagenome TaxID=938273 RepID=A0A0W8F0X8_9ZZZZ
MGEGAKGAEGGVLTHYESFSVILRRSFTVKRAHARCRNSHGAGGAGHLSDTAG